MSEAAAPSIEAERGRLLAAKRLLAGRRARDSLLAFTSLTMPDPAAHDDPERSLYQIAVHHRAIAEALEKVERGEILRLIISMPPRHGKSELASKRFLAWCIGRHPDWQIIFSTYSQEFAEDFGRASREIIRMPAYRQVFPNVKLKPGSAASDRLELVGNGLMFFVGVGGAVTGRGADLLVIDDPFKNREEADSAANRKKLWDFFTSTAYTRLMPGGRIVIIKTRWHEDGIVGRIKNPDFTPPAIAGKWVELVLPAIHDGKALWPERYPLAVLEETRDTIGPRDWSALYQQSPTPDDGDYFKKNFLVIHREPGEYPRKEDLHFYGASDHALSKKEGRDYTVMGCVGVDENDEIWVWPDLSWSRIDALEQVNEMLALRRRHKPIMWWAERDHITKSIGPFLQKMETEERLPLHIDELSSAKDKRTKARAIQGMMAMKRVHFPGWAPWWPRAESELLKFDNDVHDDFVDFLANIGRGLQQQFGRRQRRAVEIKPPASGSLAWMKQSIDYEKRRNKAAKAVRGF